MSLSNFLSSFQSLLEAHDMVASKCYEVPPPTEVANDAAVNNALMQADAVRMIGIRKKAGEPLVSDSFECVCVVRGEQVNTCLGDSLRAYTGGTVELCLKVSVHTNHRKQTSSSSLPACLLSGRDIPCGER